MSNRFIRAVCRPDLGIDLEASLHLGQTEAVKAKNGGRRRTRREGLDEWRHLHVGRPVLSAQAFPRRARGFSYFTRCYNLKGFNDVVSIVRANLVCDAVLAPLPRFLSAVALLRHHQRDVTECDSRRSARSLAG